MNTTLKILWTLLRSWNWRLGTFSRLFVTIILNKRPFALEESKIDVKSVDLKQRHCSTSFSASSKAFSLHLIYFSYYEINHVVCRWGAYFKVMKHTKKVDKYSSVKLERRYCYRYRLQKTEFLSSPTLLKSDTIYFFYVPNIRSFFYPEDDLTSQKRWVFLFKKIYLFSLANYILFHLLYPIFPLSLPMW